MSQLLFVLKPSLLMLLSQFWSISKSSLLVEPIDFNFAQCNYIYICFAPICFEFILFVGIIFGGSIVMFCSCHLFHFHYTCIFSSHNCLICAWWIHLNCASVFYSIYVTNSQNISTLLWNKI
jgi:hypothetical protein